MPVRFPRLSTEREREKNDRECKRGTNHETNGNNNIYKEIILCMTDARPSLCRTARAVLFAPILFARYKKITVNTNEIFRDYLGAMR